MKRTTLALVMAASLAAASCLQKDTTSTVYLRQDGSFDWVVLERNVRSDDTDAATRAKEEAVYVDSFAHGEHGVAKGFYALGAGDVRVRWLRRTRPYAVMVDGRFDSLTGVFEQFLAKCGIPHDVGTTQEGDATTWRLFVDAGPDGKAFESSQAEGCDGDLDGLSDAFTAAIVLESGRFTEATGFKLEGPDKAVVDEEGLQATFEASGRIELSLTWVAR